MRFFAKIFTIFFLTFSNSSAAEPLISGFTLKNGLEVIVIENHRVNAVSHMVWYKVGGADDPDGKSGIAHFHEHAMFKGTKNIKPGEFEKIVARLGGVQNAFTSYDSTAYYINISKQNLGKVMELEAERMSGLLPNPIDIEKEREVIIEERRQRVDNVPSAKLSEQMNAVMFLNHPYGTPLIGWQHEMKTLTLAEIQKFHSQHYHPNNAVLILSGDITQKEAKLLAEKFYGKLKPAEIPKRNWRQEPEMSAAKRVSMFDKNTQKPLWYREYIAPSVVFGDKENAIPLMLFAECLGGRDTSVLYQELVVKKKVATSIDANYNGFSRGPSTFSISASPSENISLLELEKSIDEALEFTLKNGVSEEDFSRAKNLFVADLVYSQEGLQGMASIVGTLRMLDLPANWLNTWQEKINNTTIEQAINAARKTLILERSVTGTLEPEKGGV